MVNHKGETASAEYILPFSFTFSRKSALLI